MSRGDGAVFAGVLGFGARGTAAAVDGGIAINVLEKRPAAVGRLVMDNTQRTGFADLCANGPIDLRGQKSHRPHPCPRAFGRSPR